VGAGPSGLLLGLLLAKHGIDVHILEASHELDQQPRAAAYGPPAIPELKRAGILDEIRARGLVLGRMTWRKFSDLSAIAGIDGDVLRDVDGEDLRITVLPLQDLDQLMLDIYLEKYGGKISWRHKVTSVHQDGNKAWVDVETPGEPKQFEADYVIGCDGANGQVRKSLFGAEFPGFTWDAQIIATNVS
jgi:2-polyprenyl-6-methoxyphenol hydroxylase-like FAD-dependent oxidoreductase